MFRKYQTITFFACLACMLSLYFACSNDDVPVVDSEMEPPGSSVLSRLVGDWTCVESQNESLIPVGFFFTVSQNMIVSPQGGSVLIHSGLVQREGGKRYKFGDGPALQLNILPDDKLSLTYTSDTIYAFSFVRPE